MADLLINSPMEYEPLRKNRFIVRFPSDLGIQSWWVQSANRPTITMNATEIPFINTSTWVVGRYIWEAFDITLRDPIGPSASQAVMEWVRLESESATGRQGYAISYKRDLTIEMLDPTGAAVSLWVCKNCMPVTVNFGDLDYGDDSLSTITINIRPDYCLLSF